MTDSPLATLGLFIACGAALGLLAYLSDAVGSCVERVVFDRTFGFPRPYRVGDAHPARRSRAWVDLRQDTLGGSSAIRLRAAMCEEGLAFDVGSWSGHRLMRPVVVPWCALHLDVGPAPHRERTLVVLDPEGSAAVSFRIMPFDLRWRDGLASRIGRASGQS